MNENIQGEKVLSRVRYNRDVERIWEGGGEGSDKGMS